MSALPVNVVEFQLPKRKPKIVEKAAPPDQRSVAVLPIRALVDKQLTDGTFRVLALLCSYCNRAGLTWVSQARLGEDMKVSRQAITKHIGKLVTAGYVEVSKKAWRGEKPNTLRVIFDPSIKTEDAVAITSSIEDTRSPEMVRADRQRAPMEGSRPKPFDVPKDSRSSPSRLPPVSLDGSHGREPNHHRTTIEPSVKQAAERPQERLADDGLPEMSAEQIEANKRRLRELLATMGGSPNFRTHQPQRLGDLMPRAKKSTTNHRQPNEVANGQSSHKQPNTVANEQASHRQLHRQPHGQPNEVAQNTENTENSKVIYRLFKERFKDCYTQPELIEVMLGCMTDEQAVEVLAQVEGRYQAEGLQLPTMPTVINDMILTHSARHLEGATRG
jgi:hypothetical protein